MATFNGILKFGSFAVNGNTQILPTRPWVTNGYPGDLSGRGRGNIVALSEGSEFSLVDTHTNELAHITWVYIKDGNKQLYISNKVLLTNVSWNILNYKGMIYGTPVTIDGTEYKLRSLTKTEWQNIVENQSNITGLPIPTTEDKTPTNTYGQLDGKHNEMWNWWGVYTTCRETVDGGSLEKGFSSVIGTSYYSAGGSTMSMGWRPVLERIESDPPEKPTIVTPTGTETEPSVTKEDPIQVETTFNNPGGEFKWMDIEVFDIDQNKNIVQNSNVASTEYFIRSGTVKGNRYRIKLKHQNTAGQYSPYAEAYFIYGELNKYKLSEPITANQYDKVKAYTGGENLKMKSQTFPETENSVIRLLPQTMNTITAGETNTKELEFSTSTKQPVVGDRLIKDKEVYTISEVETASSETHSNSPILQVTDNATNSSLSWSGDTSRHSYLYKGNIYFVCRTPSQAMVYKVPVTGGIPQQTWSTSASTSSGIRGIALAGKNNMIHVVVGITKALNILSIDLDTGERVITTLGISFDPMGVSATIDSKLGHLVVVMKGSDGTSNQPYRIVGYRIQVDGLNKPSIYSTTNIDAGYTNDKLGNPYILDTGDFRDNNLSVAYMRNYEANKAQIIECIWGGDTASRQARVEINTSESNNSRITSAEHINKLGERTLIIAYSYPDASSSSYITGAVKQHKNENGVYVVTSDEVYHSATSISTLKLTYEEDRGFILVLATATGVILKAFTLGHDHEWSSTFSVGTVGARGSASVFDTVDFNPYRYGNYPGLLVLDYSETDKADRLILKADYILRKPKPNKIILDNPISTSGGEKIKFLDYDLEVKAEESIATITPTNITDTYYEYDAKFDKKEAERDITIKGRNTKLTTLYYYNY
ncbi:hypothetical protein [Clostridium sporogenes]|uniref:hypothetical protein n=2 Tax=Bacteria TaxID=2 RepID=UPI0005EF8B7E|nr:hypothetical protein [Clostridium sporogenes]